MNPALRLARFRALWTDAAPKINFTSGLNLDLLFATFHGTFHPRLFYDYDFIVVSVAVIATSAHMTMELRILQEDMLKIR